MPPLVNSHLFIVPKISIEEDLIWREVSDWRGQWSVLRFDPVDEVRFDVSSISIQKCLMCATYLFLKPQQKFCSYLCCLFIIYRFIEVHRKTLPLPPPLNALTSFCASFTFHMDSVPSSRQVQINGARLRSIYFVYTAQFLSESRILFQFMLE